MFGNKLRSWMEAVRPRKKQQRKEKQHKLNVTMGSVPTAIPQNSPNVRNGLQAAKGEFLEETIQTMTCHTTQTPRYSAGANLSSPESAYSTGYSTDGTSPGVPPPEYYINIRTASHKLEKFNKDTLVTTTTPPPPRPPLRTPLVNISSRNNISPKHDGNVEVGGKERRGTSTATVHFNGDQQTIPSHTNNVIVHNNNYNPTAPLTPRLSDIVVNSALTSPRQRNRIRTNPWVPSGNNNLSPGNSSVVLHVVHRQQEQLTKSPMINSPIRNRYMGQALTSSPVKYKIPHYSNCSLSSSSCSSLSATSLHWDATNLLRHSGASDEAEDDDCTLNEMMGKYDESYVYEKETDILSDSDPTDCETTDIDTGQDGGDEDEQPEQEFDFIDNGSGSYLEFSEGFDERNTGHCTYHNFESQRRTSYRRNVRRSHKQQQQQASEKRKRSSSSKKRQRHVEFVNKFCYAQIPMIPGTGQVDGSKSAGATPLSVRRTKQPISKLALEYQLKKRSNSVNLYGGDKKKHTAVSTFDKRDKEADKKYKELIVEAEHILMTMKNNSASFSPRRVPGPANKRVELLRSAESAKSDVYLKSRLIEDQLANVHLSNRIPSNNFNSPRFSPKRNHITNFINNNSPVLVRREVLNEARPAAIVTPLAAIQKQTQMQPQLKNKPILRTTDQSSKRSPRYKKKLMKSSTSNKKTDENSYSSDSETGLNTKTILRNKCIYINEFDCPQSEPVKRKVYSNQNKHSRHFNVNYEGSGAQKSDTLVNDDDEDGDDDNNKGNENLRHQALLNTIVNLKRSLEDQSASLQQVYRSTQDLHL